MYAKPVGSSTFPALSRIPGRREQQRRNLEQIPAVSASSRAERIRPLEERIELLADAPEQEERKRGISVSIIVSIVVHSLLLIWFFVFYHPVSKDAKPAPTQILRYVELMKQSPDFVEAPGNIRLEFMEQDPA